jgi:hypothetical protein
MPLRVEGKKIGMSMEKMHAGKRIVSQARMKVEVIGLGSFPF